jgi:tetratricopeptide (TPR) repeat protein
MPLTPHIQLIVISGCFAAFIALPVFADKESQVAISTIAGNPVLHGGASVERNLWSKLYDSGNKALNERLYAIAEHKILACLKELQRTGARDNRLALARKSLAEIYIATERYSQAERILNSSVGDIERFFGARSKLTADYYNDLAKSLVCQGKNKKAEEYCDRALKIRTALFGGRHHDVGLSYKTRALILTKEGWFDEAKDYYQKALLILKAEPGYEQMDYADALDGMGIVLRNEGNSLEAKQYFLEAHAIKEKAIKLNVSANQKGLVRFTWREGVSDSKQVYDSAYPLKYMVIDGVRVAATVVRSEHLVACLVSIANCKKEGAEIGVGPVSLQELLPKQRYLAYIDPGILDLPLEEQHIVTLTWRRHWLNHIQKTRIIPGYIAHGALDPDNFFGNNVFGQYGNWGIAPREKPPVVTREQYFQAKREFDLDPETNQVDPVDYLTGSALEYRPVFIEAGDARTGFIFFQHERFDKACLRVSVGNTIVEFPFKALPN